MRRDAWISSQGSNPVENFSDGLRDKLLEVHWSNCHRGGTPSKELSVDPSRLTKISVKIICHIKFRQRRCPFCTNTNYAVRARNLGPVSLTSRPDRRRSFFGQIRPNPPCTFALLKPDNRP